MDVSIIIVNFNTKDLIRSCLSSVYEHTHGIDFEVIISDNGSTDGSLEMIKEEYPQVCLLENKKNLGFGTANNRASKNAKGKYIFFLNSDTVLLNNAVKIFFDYWENTNNKSIGALGAWLLNQENNIIHSYGEYKTYSTVIKHFFRCFISSYFRTLFKRITKKQKKTTIQSCNELVINGYITGADLFIKNNDSKYFDERYFMYSEEEDLQLNNYFKNELDCILLNTPKIIHLEGGSDYCKKTTNYDFRHSSYNL